MGLALQKSTDGGTTFQQVSVDVADYTVNGVVCTDFYGIIDSKLNYYLLCIKPSGDYRQCLIKISNTNVKTKTVLTGGTFYVTNPRLTIDRSGQKLLFGFNRDSNRGISSVNITDLTDGSTITPSVFLGDGLSYSNPWCLYQDRYIWVASGNTVRIYDYDTKEIKASNPTESSLCFCCDANNIAYNISINKLEKFVFNGISTITKTTYSLTGAFTNAKQLLIDKWGDLIILTNSGTASTLLKYSNAGTLIQNLNLSVPEILGVGKGAYGLQVYSSDDGTKCWVQFSNDLGTWRTEETTAQGQVFGAVSKLRDNGVTTYGDDHGGDNNYSVRC